MVDQDRDRMVEPTLDSRSVPQLAELPGAPRSGKLGRILSRWAARNWRMRWRVLALVLIPSVAAIALGAVRIQAAQSTANNAADIQQLGVLGGDITSLAESIQDERTLAAGFAAARDAGQASAEQAQTLLPKLQAQEQTTNARVATVQGLAGQIGSGFPQVARTDLTLALSSLGELSELRTLTQGNGSEMSSLPLIEHYSSVISQLLAFDDDIAAGSSSARLEQTVASLNALGQTEEQASQQQGILYGALLEGQFELGALSTLTAAESSQSGDLASFQSVGTTLPADVPGSGLSVSLTESQQYNDTVVGPPVDEALGIEQDATTVGGGQRLDGGQAQLWFSDMSATVGDMRTVEGDVLSSITVQAGSLQQGAESSEELTAALVLVLLLAVLAVSIFLARSMIRPLRRLREDALDVASRRLPDVVRRLSESKGEDSENITIEPIGINSTDEIGEVARAFDQVHREAVRLAGDEAMLRANLNAMFVNLSRRSQSLIERQLGIIDTLEQSEQDADRLSNLFRLDHLATRMRRNSENLLVLAGHETPRKWSQPVPLVDVLRAAISEIEQYERIVLGTQPGIVVSGRAASDVVHLVAELAENATAFSPDESQVVLTAQHVSSGGVLLDIADNGLGIPEEELAYANWRLDNPPVVDVAVSRRMGLFVVGRLASRHGIRVRLKRSGTGGVSAMIWLPDAVTESEAPPFGTLRRRFGTDGYGTDGYGAVGGAAMTQDAAMTQGAAAASLRPAVPGPRWSPSRPQTGPVTRMEPNEPITRMEPNESGWGAFTPRNPVSPPVGQPLASPPVSAPPVSIPPVSAQAAMPVPHEVPPDGTGPRLPIFDAVESDWFRRGGKPIGGSKPAAGSAAGSATGGAATEPWVSPADDGFRAARAAASPTVGETTSAGLPRRVPNANLVPGSIGGQANGQDGSGADAAQAGNNQQSAAPADRRSPEEARGRMAGLQRGSREGRAVAAPSYWTDES
jgi:signal transduction histidine kinase